MANLLFLLFAGHALCDYPLQGDFLSKGKNHRAPLLGVPWYQCLFAHALIHGGMVAWLTGVWWLGLAETVIHAAIDYGKCDLRYGFNVDQLFHFACKVAWWLIILIALHHS